MASMMEACDPLVTANWRQVQSRHTHGWLGRLPLRSRSRIYPTSAMFGGEVEQARLRAGEGWGEGFGPIESPPLERP